MLNFLWEFIKRNIFAIVLVVTLLVAMPWLGYIIAVPLIFMVVLGAMVSWRLYKLQSRMRDEANRQRQQYGGGATRGGSRKEGEVTIVRTEPTEQKVNDNVGEYVDFKEVEDEERNG
ncbi:MAG: DUF4834 family protein [Rikenellaceae bacterium]|nr:DUF4834 family protein [Rikenellaceae bacterium]